MAKPTIEIIVAVDLAGGFGRQGQIPWKCKEDMKRFTTVSKEIKVCVMGRNTYDDMVAMRGTKEGVREKIIEKGILPDRKSFVVSSTLSQDDCIGATVVPDLQAVLNLYHDTDQRIAVIGGEKMYMQAIASATKIHMTVMDGHYNCDRFFPVQYVAKHFAIQTTGSIAIQTDVDGETKTVRFVNYARSAS